MARSACSRNCSADRGRSMCRRGRPTAKTWRSSATNWFIRKVLNPARRKNVTRDDRVPLPGFLRAQPDGTLLSVKLQPRASANDICAPPVDAAANEALVKFLAEKLDCSRGRVELIRGHTSRHKTVKLHGFKPGDIDRKRTQL